MNWYPERREKKTKIKEYEIIGDEVLDNETLSSIEKQKIFKKIVEKDFSYPLELISLAQLNRFYSIVDSRNYRMDSNYLKELAEKQIERAKNIGTKELKNAEHFYKQILELVKREKDQKKLKAIMILLKQYARYYIGKKKL